MADDHHHLYCPSLPLPPAMLPMRPEPLLPGALRATLALSGRVHLALFRARTDFCALATGAVASLSRAAARAASSARLILHVRGCERGRRCATPILWRFNIRITTTSAAASAPSEATPTTNQSAQGERASRPRNNLACDGSLRLAARLARLLACSGRQPVCWPRGGGRTLASSRERVR